MSLSNCDYDSAPLLGTPHLHHPCFTLQASNHSAPILVFPFWLDPLLLQGLWWWGYCPDLSKSQICFGHCLWSLSHGLSAVVESVMNPLWSSGGFLRPWPSWMEFAANMLQSINQTSMTRVMCSQCKVWVRVYVAKTYTAFQPKDLLVVHFGTSGHLCYQYLLHRCLRKDTCWMVINQWNMINVLSEYIGSR